MAVVKNFVRRVCFWKRTDNVEHDISVRNNEEDITRTLKQYEFYVYKVQNILIWEKPSQSFLCLVGVNLLFWLLINLECRLYGIIFTAMLISTVHEMWLKRIWPEIRVKPKGDKDRRSSSSTGEEFVHPSVALLSSFIQSSRKTMRDYYVWLRNMRENNQGLFVCIMTGIFLLLSVIGRMISGILLSYMAVMLAMIGPGIWIHLVSEDAKVTILNHLRTIRSMVPPTGETSNNEEDDAEYMLEESGENLALLSQIIEPEDTNDSVYSKGSTTPISFVTGVPTMPSHDDISLDSMVSFSELDLALDGSPRTLILKDMEELSDDSSSNDPAIMDFQSGHFNGNESSGDEEEQLLAKDLTFTETDTSNVPGALPKGITLSSVFSATTSNLGTLGAAVGQSLLTSVVNRAIGITAENGSGPEDQKKFKTTTEDRKIAKNDSSNSLSSNEDFELISHDEVS